MKMLFNKREFNKLDEMEKNILAKAQKMAYSYVLVVLMIWTFYESYRVLVHNTKFYPVPFFLFMTTYFVQNIAQFVLQKQAIKGEQEFKDPNPLRKILLHIFATLVIAIIIITAVSFFVMSK